MSVNILIVDDHPLFANGVKMLLESQSKLDVNIVGVAINGQEALNFLESNGNVDTVLMDINMPVLDGIEATKTISKKFPEVKVLILSGYSEPNIVRKAINSGAKGYCLKYIGIEKLLEAIKCIQSENEYFDDDLKMILVDIIRSPEEESNDLLTTREIQILKLIVAESTNIEIAEELNVSKRTVEGHKKKIMEKIHARNTAGLVRYALENGITD